MSLIQLRECLFHWTESRKVKPGSLLLSESDSTISASQRILHLSGRISYSLGFRWFTLISWGDKEVCSSLKDVFSGHSIVKPLVRSFVYGWEEICLFIVTQLYSGLLSVNCFPHNSLPFHILWCFVEITKSVVLGPCFISRCWVLFLIPWDLEMEINQVTLSLVIF